MKAHFPKTLAGVSLAALIALALAPGLLLAQDNSIEGVWTNQITPTDCQTGTAFQVKIVGLLTFHKGGTISEFAAGLRSPGHGVWKHTTNNSFSGSFVFMNLDALGTFTGTQKITQHIQLDASGNRFTDTATFQAFDSNGTLIQSGCATAVATRFE